MASSFFFDSELQGAVMLLWCILDGLREEDVFERAENRALRIVMK